MRPNRATSMATVTMLCAMTRLASAQSANQVVTFRVNPISEIAVSGAPMPIVVDAPRAGVETSAMVGGTSYAITTNEGNQKISAALDRPMPDGVTLAVSLGAPDGGASRGLVPLGTRASDVVTAIPAGAGHGLPIVFALSATKVARRGASGTRIVTYTVSAGL